MSGVEKDSVTLHVEGNTATQEGIENWLKIGDDIT